MHTFKYQCKVLLKDKELVFWTIAFPLLLATLFNLAFANLMKPTEFESIPIAVVQPLEDEGFEAILQEMASEQDPIISIQYTTQEKAEQLLLAESIDGYLVSDKQIQLVVSENGIEQTILKSIIDNYYQSINIISTILSENNNVLTTEIIEIVSSGVDNFNDTSSGKSEPMLIIFYSLIGMVVMYGGFWGLKSTTMYEANLSASGARLSISPASKSKFLFNGFVIGYACNLISLLVLIAYLIFGLNIDFGEQVNLILLLLVVGNFVGVAIGSVIGYAFKCSYESKTTIVVIVSMTCSFLAGMMVVEMKYYVQEYVPFLAAINPVSLVTDALYALYYNGDFTTAVNNSVSNARYFGDIQNLMLIGIIAIIISVLLARRKQYDSI